MAIHVLMRSGDLPPYSVLRTNQSTTYIVPRFQRYLWFIRAASVEEALVCAITNGSYSTLYPSASIDREK